MKRKNSIGRLRGMSIAAMAAFALFIGCSDGPGVSGSGTLATGHIDGLSFTEIDFLGSYPYRIDCTQGTDCLVEITTDDNILPWVKVSVFSGTLTIVPADSYPYPGDVSGMATRFDVKVTAPVLDSIYVSQGGGGGVILHDYSTSADLRVEASRMDVTLQRVTLGNLDLESAASYTLEDVTAEEVTSDSSSDMTGTDCHFTGLQLEPEDSMEVDITGTADRLEVAAGGDSRIDLSGLSVPAVTVTLEDDAHADVWATLTLDYELHDNSRLFYRDVPVTLSGERDPGASIEAVAY
jgi:hypothetical protein